MIFGVIPMNFNEKYFREEIDSEEHKNASKRYLRKVHKVIQIQDVWFWKDLQDSNNVNHIFIRNLILDR